MIHTIRAAAPGMQERGYGRIVNIASNAAIGTALPGTTFYAAAKAEVLILLRAVLRWRWGVGESLVNAVAPGWIVTEMARAGDDRDTARTATTPRPSSSTPWSRIDRSLCYGCCSLRYGSCFKNCADRAPFAALGAD